MSSIPTCPHIGGGVQRNLYTLPASGNVTGTWVSYFRNGTLHGKFNLVPQETGLSANPMSFSNASYMGPVTVAGGTGLYKGAKGTGTATCTTPDGLHYDCKEQLTLKKL